MTNSRLCVPDTYAIPQKLRGNLFLSHLAVEEGAAGGNTQEQPRQALELLACMREGKEEVG